jgi:hypothetical protein
MKNELKIKIGQAIMEGHAAVGLRVKKGNEKNGYSYRWEDGKKTKEELSGLSTIGIARHGEIIIEDKQADKLLTKYGEEKDIIVIAGDFAEWGEDAKEMIISNAVII